MQDISHILGELKQKGRRQSATRALVLEALAQSPQPLTHAGLQCYLAERRAAVNKTTVYRELDFLVGEGIVRELQLRGEAKYYELTPGDHHHHAICTNCDTINHVAVKERFDLPALGNFKVSWHSLEFYGLCANCQK